MKPSEKTLYCALLSLVVAACLTLMGELSPWVGGALWSIIYFYMCWVMRDA
jgi:Ca2+/Na+ antiporter